MEERKGENGEEKEEGEDEQGKREEGGGKREEEQANNTGKKRTNAIDPIYHSPLCAKDVPVDRLVSSWRKRFVANSQDSSHSSSLKQQTGKTNQPRKNKHAKQPAETEPKPDRRSKRQPNHRAHQPSRCITLIYC